MSKILYEQLGGEKGISAIVTDVIANYLKNPPFSAKFQETHADKLHRVVVEFFGIGSGGPR